MNQIGLLNSSKILTGIFIISLLVLVFFANVSFRQISSINESEKLVLHSFKENLELEQLHSYLKDAETGQRGYIITHDSLFLQPYIGAREKVNKSFLALKTLTKDNDVQNKNLDTLFDLINTRFAWMVTTLRFSQSELNTSEALKNQLVEGKKAMDEIRFHINKMINIEKEILQQREKQHQDYLSFTPFTSLLVVLFSLMVFVFAFYKITKDRIELKNLNQQLLKRNKELELQILDEFSTEFVAYKSGDEFINSITHELALKTNSEYVFVGELTLNNAKETIIKTKSFYSNGILEENLEFKLEGGPWEYFELGKLNSYPKDCKKIFNKNDTILVYNIDAFVGCPLFSADSKPIGMIAVMQQKEIKELSYTTTLLKIAAKRTELELEKINYQIMLETKNVELERHNTELASFNYIASHDLQEPLRKIITFSNRLSQKYVDTLPEGSSEYIDKIVYSAKRMSSLIEDLLNFSWISNTTEAFEQTDLNEIVRQVLIDLEESVVQKNAKVILGPLPILKANPLQMTQLFLNLIGNGIKFSREANIPELTISAKELCKAEILEYENLPKNKDYTEIRIKDNGIGFEQKYAEKIFILFQRLHGKNEYEGTGIGLALTKKIVENHRGAIKAHSELNKGTEFVIILPLTE